MKLSGKLLNSAIYFCILISTSLNAASPVYNLQIELASEDFKGNTETFNQITGSVRYGKGLSRHSVINLNADLFTRHFADIDSRDSNGVLTELVYSYIPGKGFTKPVYSIALRQEFEVFDESSQDFSKTSLILADTIRLDDRITFTAGLEYLTKSSDLEDITSNGLFLNTDLQLNSKLIVYINLKIQDEKIETITINVANVPQFAERYDMSGHHTPGETGLPTPSLPDSSSGSDTNSDNFISRLGINYFFSSNQSIDVSYEYSQYALSNNVDIQGNVISLDYFYKF
ncbi:MAG: hypothetical protein HOM14_19610 [Gammaproteobacteria bacterium]|jgi:opacity protein-like surface antigen|nr:hypothetical protein [Gammaproteobacteria bacterium]MBT3721872.1 hypothetical protein [Gammaproteobacteria bacterium]MBT4075531.1 hypothetical protein [Gammaproteobacteria bacterium]MBT4196923.1 hypothetical protein [Gammaproteobacteria bacterium]MBT4451361.1 hypothetical protein [Gammaproteobacteria bacterium]